MSVGFVSYAQNFEDVMLWRALSHVDCGFYIDVGAQHPTIDSISLAFYERGWTGIDIEPVPEYASLLREQRSRNEVLQMALSNRSGKISLTVVPDTGLSTVSPKLAANLRAETEKYPNLALLEVDQCRVSDLSRYYDKRSVHWMKIDVEGYEREVLEGWDPAILRPWILVVEATVPNSGAPDYSSWEPIVVDAGYRCVYKDGLNRFYLANEHGELAGAFEYPPNVFDDIRLRPHSAMLQDLVAEHLRDVRQRAASYQRQLLALQHFQAKYEAVLESASWKLTAPLRMFLAWVIRLISLKDRWMELRGWRNRVMALRKLALMSRGQGTSRQSAKPDRELSPDALLWLDELTEACERSKESR